MSEMFKCKNCGNYFFVGSESNDDGEFLYYTQNTEFCSNACQIKHANEYAIKRKKEYEEREKQWKKEQEEQERKMKYENPRCVWCGKNYARKESMAINRSFYCCKKCEAEAQGYRPK